MIIQDDTKQLIEALNEEDTTILLLSGSSATDAGAIHAFLQQHDPLEDWHRYFLVAKLDILNAEQRDTWFGGTNENRYAVLGGTSPKVVASTGDVAQFLGPKKRPSIRQILLALAEGDKI